MRNLIRELRRREVFRTTGLYVGVMWILIEAASVLLPAFDIPDWVLRALIIVGITGLPVAVVLAWFFDFTDHGIEIQAEATDTVVMPFGRRRTDFVVIGVLTVALIFSVYLNFTSGPEIVEELEPISVLIADFDNQTDEPLFDGTLEQALNLGIEGAAFVTSYRRSSALSQAKDLEFGETLDEEAARLVAVRQDVKLVLAGSIAPDGDRFDLTLRAVNPSSGEVTADVDTRADSKADVLSAINTLAAEMRKELGDKSMDVDLLARGETVTVTSLEALKHYVTAQDLARQSKDEQAIEYYAKAVEIDPSFARALSGWGLSAFKIGRDSEAEAQWEQALALLDRMTRREQHRTLGLYYTAVSLNYEKAIETYEQLTTEFPADSAGHNNLSVLYFLTSKFDKAVAESARLIEIYPERTLYLSNHALNAMWAGDLETAVRVAETVISKDPEAFKPHMVLAMAALDADNIEGALEAYRKMATTGARGQSLASIGMADVALFEQRLDDAASTLTAGIAVDSAANNERGIGTKTVALAQTLYAQDQPGLALETVRSLDTENAGDGQLVPTAEMLVALGNLDDASEIAAGYGAQLRPKSRAYAALIEGMIAMHQDEHVAAIDAIRSAIDHQDLWIARFYLGQAYLAAGYPAEAASEFDTAWQRRGEAMAMFFDDVPTWRYMSQLEQWRERARQSLSDMASG